VQPEPLVSVIIPAYNAEGTIRNAIESVLRQTVSDLEVIVADDASADNTTQVVSTIPDPRVRLVKAQTNSGPSAARNLGVKGARGRWVAFLDADDEWVPDRLGYLLGAAQGDERFVADWFAPCSVAPDGRLTPVENPLLPTDGGVDDFDFVRFLKLGRCVYPIVPKVAFDTYGVTFPEWGSGGEWAFLIARLSASGVRGKLVHRVGYLYRVTGAHDGSTLRAIEEQLKVQEFLAKGPGVSQEAMVLLQRGIPGIRKRLVVAALREGKWRKLAHYASKNPTDLLILPGSVVRFLLRKLQYWRASRNPTATENLG